MTQQELVQKVTDFTASSPENLVSETDAIHPRLAGLQIYEAPIFGFAAAGDGLFISEYKKKGSSTRNTWPHPNGCPAQKR